MGTTLPIGAVSSYGAGAVRGGHCTVCIQGTFTTSTGVFTATGEPNREYTLGSFTSGVATLTFPKHLSFLFAAGEHDTDNSSAASRFTLRVTAVNLAAGTATVRSVLESNGTTDTTHAAPTGLIRLVVQTGD